MQEDGHRYADSGESRDVDGRERQVHVARSQFDVKRDVADDAFAKHHRQSQRLGYVVDDVRHGATRHVDDRRVGTGDVAHSQQAPSEVACNGRRPGVVVTQVHIKRRHLPSDSQRQAVTDSGTRGGDARVSHHGHGAWNGGVRDDEAIHFNPDQCGAELGEQHPGWRREAVHGGVKWSNSRTAVGEVKQHRQHVHGVVGQLNCGVAKIEQLEWNNQRHVYGHGVEEAVVANDHGGGCRSRRHNDGPVADGLITVAHNDSMRAAAKGPP